MLAQGDRSNMPNKPSVDRGGGSVLKYKTYIPLIALSALFLIATTPYPKNGILVPWY